MNIQFMSVDARDFAMIDPNSEQIVTFTEAAKLPPRRNVATLFRWRQRGIRNVKLETMMYGGRRVTSLEALDRFFARVTAAADGEPARAETPRRRKRQIERAERRAEELGL
jgi:hypothetical protein